MGHPAYDIEGPGHGLRTEADRSLLAAAAPVGYADIRRALSALRGCRPAEFEFLSETAIDADPICQGLRRVLERDRAAQSKAVAHG